MPRGTRPRRPRLLVLELETPIEPPAMSSQSKLKTSSKARLRRTAGEPKEEAPNSHANTKTRGSPEVRNESANGQNEKLPIFFRDNNRETG